MQSTDLIQKGAGWGERERNRACKAAFGVSALWLLGQVRDRCHQGCTAFCTRYHHLSESARDWFQDARDACIHRCSFLYPVAQHLPGTLSYPCDMIHFTRTARVYPVQGALPARLQPQCPPLSPGEGNGYPLQYSGLEIHLPS